mmetsp:Transcript_30417/g.57516  ORF Transcript_30417/g.57516 Transcript_30417/m.57516 type:complete len:93 (-) Transcript_30417:15-293(-)
MSTHRSLNVTSELFACNNFDDTRDDGDEGAAVVCRGRRVRVLFVRLFVVEAVLGGRRASETRERHHTLDGALDLMIDYSPLPAPLTFCELNI